MLRVVKYQKLVLVFLSIAYSVAYCPQYKLDPRDLSFDRTVLLDSRKSLKDSLDILNYHQLSSSACEQRALRGAYCTGGGSCIDVVSHAIADLRTVTASIVVLLDLYPHHAPKMHGREGSNMSFRGLLLPTHFLGELHGQAMRVIYDASISTRRYQHMIENHESKLSEVVMCADNDICRMMRQETRAQQFLPLILRQRTAAEHLNFVLWSILAQVEQLKLASSQNNPC